MSNAILIQGTTIESGSSFVISGLLRALKEDGHKVAPFSIQIYTNKYVTLNNGKIISSNLIKKSEAAMIRPDQRMNPIILIPETKDSTKIILNGEFFCTIPNSNFREVMKTLEYYIEKAFNSLKDEYDIIVIEGFNNFELTSKSNFIDFDLAKYISAPVVLVGDYTNGNAIATLKGSLDFLTTQESNLVKGLILNKYTHPNESFEKFKTSVSPFLNKKILGFVPFSNLNLDDDDENALREDLINDAKYIINISVIGLPKVINFNDLNGFGLFTNIQICYITNIEELSKTDLIIIPDTSDCISDLNWLKSKGFEDIIKTFVINDTPILGIDGGMKILSKTIIDENNNDTKGLGYLDIETKNFKETSKIDIEGKLPIIEGILKRLSKKTFEGTVFFNEQDRENKLLVCNDNIYGTNIHKLFNNEEITKEIINSLVKKKNIMQSIEAMNLKVCKDDDLSELANILRFTLDFNEIYKIINNGV